MTAAERAEAISAELWSISRPPKVRTEAEATNYLFGWLAHPGENKAVLTALNDYIIRVHPQNNLTNLLALFPELTEAEKQGLASFINSQQAFPFQHIIPSNTIQLTEQEFLNEYQDGTI